MRNIANVTGGKPIAAVAVYRLGEISEMPLGIKREST
jgi:hypothetical protein